MTVEFTEQELKLLQELILNMNFRGAAAPIVLALINKLGAKPQGEET